MPGVIDMPSAESAPDAQLTTTIGSFAGTFRNTLSFQMTPRLSGSYRYTVLANWNTGGFTTYFDRSFDIHYKMLDETRYFPAVAVGLRDLIGTGLYSGEYIVATKSLTPNLKVTGGIGWGRLGSSGSFSNPLSAILGSGFDTRSAGFGLGGVPGIGNWFRGPAAFFGGVEWQTPNPKLKLKVEYSSDAYIPESVTRSIFTRRSPINFAVDYRVNRSVQLSGYYLYGSEIGFKVSMSMNPKISPANGSLEAAPVPVFRRPETGELGFKLRADTGWVNQPDVQTVLLGNLQVVLAAEGFVIEMASFTGKRAEVRVRNTKYESTAQAVGRVARMMTRVLPLSIDTFVVTPVENGMALVSVTLLRQDLEDLENDPEGVRKSFDRAHLSDPVSMIAGAVRNDEVYPSLSWQIGPYLRYSLFDPDNPVRIDVGLRVQAEWEVARGVVISGSAIKKAAGNLDSVTRTSNSVIQHVRSDFGLYDKQADPALEYLQVDFFFRPGRDLYGRVTAGYLERMYGGVSAELLWKPIESRLAIGAEVNLVRQRAYDGGFGFRSYQVGTGNVSAYLDMRNGYSAQVDVGRYLAGDWGATFAFDRTFNNGWKVGAFFTLTTVSFADFGEGSFDKGLRFTIPISWSTGKPSRDNREAIIRPLTRDGGARLKIRNRLYDQVNVRHKARLAPTWGRFWR
ncbi:MAG: YjbH domain-containing protein [Alphaproteobacteria bacterium]|nr:YjbH domain-containing protein [Alphaproteobacteria bacterium]